MPTGIYERKPLVERFWEKADKKGPEDCWEWQNGKVCGYGEIGFHGKVYRATRISLYLKNGEMPPDDKCVCHKCNNPACVNPAHLYIGTQKENMDDMYAACRNKQPKGELNANSKLNEKKVRAIREIYKLGNITHRQLARLYGVSNPVICRIINRKIWQHVK